MIDQKPLETIYFVSAIKKVEGKKIAIQKNNNKSSINPNSNQKIFYSNLCIMIVVWSVKVLYYYLKSVYLEQLQKILITFYIQLIPFNEGFIFSL